MGDLGRCYCYLMGQSLWLMVLESSGWFIEEIKSQNVSSSFHHNWIIFQVGGDGLAVHLAKEILQPLELFMPMSSILPFLVLSMKGLGSKIEDFPLGRSFVDHIISFQNSYCCSASTQWSIIFFVGQMAIFSWSLVIDITCGIPGDEIKSSWQSWDEWSGHISSNLSLKIMLIPFSISFMIPMWKFTGIHICCISSSRKSPN